MIMAKLIEYSSRILVAGVDEAGRGAIAGPVTASAVILKSNFHLPKLNDSKLVSPKQRFKLQKIIQQESLSWAVAHIDAKEIDRINILNATFNAMIKAIKLLKINPELILVDGNQFPGLNGINHKCVIKGDRKYKSIAAASILAKTHRDQLMIRIAKSHPAYHWEKNKGYPTKYHKLSIVKSGTTSFHRKTFHCK